MSYRLASRWSGCAVICTSCSGHFRVLAASDVVQPRVGTPTHQIYYVPSDALAGQEALPADKPSPPPTGAAGPVAAGSGTGSLQMPGGVVMASNGSKSQDSDSKTQDQPVETAAGWRMLFPPVVLILIAGYGRGLRRHPVLTGVGTLAAAVILSLALVPTLRTDCPAYMENLWSRTLAYLGVEYGPYVRPEQDSFVRPLSLTPLGGDIHLPSIDQGQLSGGELGNSQAMDRPSAVSSVGGAVAGTEERTAGNTSGTGLGARPTGGAAERGEVEGNRSGGVNHKTPLAPLESYEIKAIQVAQSITPVPDDLAAQGYVSGEGPIRLGDVEIRIRSVGVRRVPLRLAGINLTSQTDQVMLMIDVQITNLSQERTMEYLTWAGEEISFVRDYASVTDQLATMYPRVTFDQQRLPEGRVIRKTLTAGRITSDILVFKAPPPSVTYLKLELPGGNVGVRNGMAKVFIPEGMVQR
ncbi:MAG: hypothetical protein IT443_00950 [Phycisphaeraceae bacterium]|nr:hypothetical protein [Phycisphaeraceae bacterium]